MKRTLCSLLKSLVISSALISSSFAANLRLGLITPPSHQWSISANELAQELKEKSNGEINLLVFPSGQLGSEAQMLQQLQSGALDMAFLVAGEIANRRPNYAALFAPYLVDTPAEVSQLLQGPTATKMLEELNSLGLVGLGYGMAGMRQILVRQDLQSADQLKGKKIRTIPIEPELDFWRKVGAAPTPMPLPALYDAFANGQIDGMQIDFEGSWNVKYIDNAKTVLHSNHMMLPMVAVASARKWGQMSAEQKELISSLTSKHLQQIILAYEKIDADYLAQIEANSSAKILTTDRAFFGDSVDTWYEEWRKKSPVLSQLESEAAAIKAQTN